MKKFVTDVHNHSTFSFDGEASLKEMTQAAQEKGVAFYGMAEHVDYDALCRGDEALQPYIDGEAYFHEARHLQEDYAGVMNVLVGAEFAYTDDKRAWEMYRTFQEKYSPDFIVNSLHSNKDGDYYYQRPYYTETGELRDKKEVYGEYLALIQRSLCVPYAYDIVGHFGYVVRYAPYADKALRYGEFSKEIDGILLAVIAQGKILEVNSSNNGGVGWTLPDRDILQRYYELGGRKISYASDAHTTDRIVTYRERTVEILKDIGFTHITVPCKGEHIEVEL
ncbi:MAG: histidinol-phosphatase HisJ family protein [Clostridia bacterium]|nr:histidinol-phosphatase HisJ family protein [Clostridia bacterium]